jgi:hypothetical protein
LVSRLDCPIREGLCLGRKKAKGLDGNPDEGSDELDPLPRDVVILVSAITCQLQYILDQMISLATHDQRSGRTAVVGYLADEMLDAE